MYSKIAGFYVIMLYRIFEHYVCKCKRFLTFVIVKLLLLLLLLAGSAAGSSAGIVFTHGQIFGFFAPRGRHVAPIKVKFGRKEVRSSMPNLTLIGPGVGVHGPKTEKNSNFTNIIVPKGRVPCTIFTKFTGYMRVLSLYKAAEFGCIISIND